MDGPAIPGVLKGKRLWDEAIDKERTGKHSMARTIWMYNEFSRSGDHSAQLVWKPMHSKTP